MRSPLLVIQCCYSFLTSVRRAIPSGKSLFLSIDTTSCSGTDTEVRYLEHVQAVISLNATRRGDVELYLRSPMGTRSMILSNRPHDDDGRDGFTKWPFMTSHTWAEYPIGKWTLEVSRRWRRASLIKNSPFFLSKILSQQKLQ